MCSGPRDTGEGDGAGAGGGVGAGSGEVAGDAGVGSAGVLESQPVASATVATSTIFSRRNIDRPWRAIAQDTAECVMAAVPL